MSLDADCGLTLEATESRSGLPTVARGSRGAADLAGPIRSPQSATRNLSGGRLAYLLQVFPKYSETFILNELLEHQRQGAAVRVVALRYPRDGRFHGCLAELEQAAEYIPESVWDKSGKLVRAAWAVLRDRPMGFGNAAGQVLAGRVEPRDLWQATLVRRWAQRRGAAHLHSHFGGYAARVAWLARKMGGPSYSVTLHAFDIFRDNVDAGLLRRIVTDAAFCVTVSRFNAAHLRERIGADPVKVRVLYNGIPLHRFAYCDSPREPGTILSVGRLIEKKGFIHLVRACALLAQRGMLARCEIVGEGPEKATLSEEINRLGLRGRVHLVGAWAQERVARALSRAAVFALPCVAAKDGNMDALPTVLLEAMAAGCPCVSTRLSGIPEIIEDGVTGRLVPPGDDAALAAAVGDLLADAELGRRFARAGRQRAESLFDVRRSVATLRGWLVEAAEASTEMRPARAPAEHTSRTSLRDDAALETFSAASVAGAAGEVPG